jgi:hypothetical protein
MDIFSWSRVDLPKVIDDKPAGFLSGKFAGAFCFQGAPLRRPAEGYLLRISSSAKAEGTSPLLPWLTPISRSPISRFIPLRIFYRGVVSTYITKDKIFPLYLKRQPAIDIYSCFPDAPDTLDALDLLGMKRRMAKIQIKFF